MREILFRGKRIDNGEWVYGYFYEDIGSFIKERASSVSTNTHHVDPSTVGQYTGLTDKNGKRIFEGDLLVLATSRPREVKFAYGGFYMEGTTLPFRYGGKFTIIGNIHDNPELLGEVTNNGN
ncbi:MAG: YopX family protein [Candidatus Faecousia sp.]|nr:YopX family protein [Candidatus Faecousia sp.]